LKENLSKRFKGRYDEKKTKRYIICMVHYFTRSVHSGSFYLRSIDMGIFHQFFQVEHDPTHALCGVGKL
jgi:hypothetical protein